MASTSMHGAKTQVLLLSAICFCCPGLFNALSSFASGLQDPTMAFAGNVLIYVCFTVSGIVASAFVGALGVPKAVMLGTLGYVLYAMALWNLQTRVLAQSTELFYAACVCLGISAGLLWTAQGQMIMSYATNENQGRYLSVFWIIFNLGATSGGLLTFLLNYNVGNDSTRHVSNATFAAFVLVMAMGTLLCLWLVDSSKVVKENNERVHEEPANKALPGSRWKAVHELTSFVAKSRTLWLLFPFFVYSNWFYTYHAFYNVSVFNARASGLASAFYWAAQMVAAHKLGQYLDRSTGSAISSIRTAKRVLWVLAFGWNAMWLCGWYTQREALHLSYEQPLGLDVSFQDTNWIGPTLLYIVYGAGDALGQVWIYWYLSAVCPNGSNVQVAGYHAGLYKSIQALSAALSWYLGAIQVDPLRQLNINWVLSNVALAGAVMSVVLIARQEERSLPMGRGSQSYESISLS
ncbi:hypothetical protein Poli38472_004123 [Pythium oligandrum]|uniref:Uncharacterized protein n=1 Tax=Pythium oligandrum TaxID=41045 RepID=A0A8K1FQ87_PYTOL|nr:hypothetical protein Poli38472_004123 [Pythium oligandrum]|eukprot:TMW66358.1 hypothetical protein Poli38472_004123 [Pythium oligandrum]